MQNAAHQHIGSWANTDEEENAMNDDHYYLWAHMIDLCINRPIGDKAVLDYGCNQGGFLDMLYKRSAFAEGMGVDIATSSLAVAEQRLTSKPVTFATPDALDEEAAKNRFDLAFSHEVLYLLPDLEAHAAQMHRVLKTKGVYYAAIGCHSDNPQWNNWLSLISEYSNINVQTYSLDDYANAFMDAGFTTSVQPFRLEGFFPLKENNRYFPTVADTLRYYQHDKVIFRLEKQ